jgi:hypothetical protein
LRSPLPGDLFFYFFPVDKNASFLFLMMTARRNLKRFEGIAQARALETWSSPSCEPFALESGWIGSKFAAPQIR